jgi:4-hydroxy-2-oxoheptanedioate aldolase
VSSMNTPLSLRERWNDGAITLGAWMFLREPLIAEVAGDAGYDYVCIDMQHGLADYSDTVAMLQGLAKSAATPIVRMPWNDPSMIGRVLDAGALGVIIPMVNTADEAAQAVAACRYAPIGKRSLGPIGAMVRHGSGYLRWANERVACLPMIETMEAVENIDEILAVPGIDGIYVGPADLSLTLGLPPLMDHADDRFQAALATIVEACQRHGVVAGIQASVALTDMRARQGFQMITVGYDQTPVITALRADLATSRAAIAVTHPGSKT